MMPGDGIERRGGARGDFVAGSCLLINAFEVPPEADDDFIRGWEAARDYLQTQPGYLDTALHRAVSPDAAFRFVNIARWQSPQQFQAAVQSPGFREASQGLVAYRPHPGLYEVIGPDLLGGLQRAGSRAHLGQLLRRRKVGERVLAALAVLGDLV
jgi:heme-degrading monooxygenase HmoA